MPHRTFLRHIELLGTVVKPAIDRALQSSAPAPTDPPLVRG